MAEPAGARWVYGERQGRVGIVTIARPERRNALNLQLKGELVMALQRFERDAEVAVLVLTGAGGCFVAGTDIAEMAPMSPLNHVRLDTGRVFNVVRNLAKPVISTGQCFMSFGRQSTSRYAQRSLRRVFSSATILAFSAAPMSWIM